MNQKKELDIDYGVTATLDQLDPIEALGVLRNNFDTLVDKMRRASAPPTGTARFPLSVKLSEAAELLGRSTNTVRIMADELGIGPQDKEERRLFTPQDMARIRHEKRIEPLPPKGASPFVLVVSNQKGGVGKTTTSTNLVQDLATRGYRVLIIDMDPQASMTSAWLLRDDEGNIVPAGTGVEGPMDTAAPVLIGESLTFDAIIRRTHWENVDIVPAHPDLSEGGLQMVQLYADGKRDFWVGFKDACQALEKDKYDVVVVDTAPSLWLDAVEIALAADALLVPVPARNLDIESCRAFVSTMHVWLSQLSERMPVKLRWLRFMMTQRIANSTSELKNEALLKSHLGPMLLNSRVPRMEALERSSGANPSVFEEQIKQESRNATRNATRSAGEARAGLRVVHNEIIELIAKSWEQEAKSRAGQ